MFHNALHIVRQVCLILIAIISFGINLVLIIWSITLLGHVRVDFEDVMIHLPNNIQIKVVNDQRFEGPVHVMCVPSLATNCDRIFGEYPPITRNQKYFSWLYLDNEVAMTVDDIYSSRESLYLLFLSNLIYSLIITCIQGLYEAYIVDKGNSEYNCWNITQLLWKVFTCGLTIIMSTIAKQLLCNLYSLSEYEQNLLVLEYIPSSAFWLLFIIMITYSCLYVCFLLTKRVNPLNQEKVVETISNNVVICCFVGIFNVIMLSLFGISQFGLMYYIFDFNGTYQVIDQENTLIHLQPTFIENTEILTQLSLYFGVWGLIQAALNLLWGFCKFVSKLK